MNHHDIRATFLNFFKELGHQQVPGANIIPAEDPTLLFINAGMNQFKDLLLGREKRDYTRAISIQPCMRVGGKHNDLDEVGRDGRHLTWFEMLGNWSFGDYGKREAIQFAWDLVSKHFPLDLSKIIASVYKDDDESYALWQEIAGFPEERIVRLGDVEAGDEENFWSMGPIGPCGRCTELYYDQGEEKFGHDVVGGETDRFLEFWNVVFMEFDRQEDGTLKPLPALSVDTGMGMERITALLEGKDNVFETSLFAPIIDYIAETSGKPKEGEFLTAMQVLADHSRALTFVLNDGGSFDRQGRGYVLRRILRRAVLHGTKLGFNEPFLHKLVAVNIENLPVYNISEERQASITAQIKDEEEKFFATLERGVAFFQDEAKQGKVSGEAAFKLHDTYGFPIDLTRIMAEEQHIAVDMDGFDAALKQQKEQSRAAGKFKDVGGWQVVQDGSAEAIPTHGLTTMECQLLRYREVDDLVEVVLDQSPFYAEGGGELADHGTLQADGIKLSVQDVGKTDRDIVHRASITSGSVAALANVTTLTASVDDARRAQKAQHHTATHLLHAALRHVLGDSVQQAGSQVDADRLRFDISFDRALTIEERTSVEDLVNTWIQQGHAVQHKPDITMAEAQELGALAFFGDKYGDKVRVIDIPGVSCELCGGNHVQNLGQIGSIYLLGDEALGSGVRRLTAIAGMAAVRHARAERQELVALAQDLAVPRDQVSNRVGKLQAALKDAQSAYKQLLKSGGGANDLQFDEVQLASQTVQLADVSALPVDSLNQQLDTLKKDNPSKVYVLVHIDAEQKGTIFIGAGAESGGHAGKIAKELGSKLGSGGGGKPDFARTGFKGKSFGEVRAVAA